VNPSLWDDSAYPISIYSLNEYLKADATNIIIFLNRIASFVKNRFLDRKKEKDIPYIAVVATTRHKVQRLHKQ